MVQTHQHLHLVFCSQEVGLVQLRREDLLTVLSHRTLHRATRTICLIDTATPDYLI